MNDTEFSNELKTRLNRILPTKNYFRNPIFMVIRDLIRVKGYWRNWERQRVWMTREIIFAMIQGNPNIPDSGKPKKREDIYKLSDDKKEISKRPKIKPKDIEQLEKITFALKH